MFLLAAALIVSDVIIFGLGHSQQYSPEAGFTFSLFQIGSPWLLVGQVVRDVVQIALLAIMLRLIGREAWALVLAALAYGLAIQPVTYLLQGVSGPGWPDAVWQAVRVLVSAAWMLGFFGSLAVAIRASRSPGAALVVGGIAGSIVATATRGAVRELASASGDWHITLGFLLRGAPIDALGGALFGLLAWAGLAAAGSLHEEDSQPYVRRPFFTGTFIAGNAIALALLLASRLLMALGPWDRWSSLGALASSREQLELLGLGTLYLVALIIATGFSIVFFRLVYRMWTAVQDGHARMTPGRAIGFMLIPVFNVYWAFPAVAGFATDFNALVRRKGVTLQPLSRGLLVAFLAFGLLGAVPYLEIAAVISYVLGIVAIRRVCDGLNALTAAGASSIP